MQGSFDPYARPPDNVRAVYKRYQKMKKADLNLDEFVLDFERGLSQNQRVNFRSICQIEHDTLFQILSNFSEGEHCEPIERSSIPQNTLVYEHADCPGLLLIPSLLPPPTQRTLISRILHRDLSSPAHKTNIHLHHQFPYPAPPKCTSPSVSAHTSACNPSTPSLFSFPPSTLPLPPNNPATHRPLPYALLLRRKLRWLTLGGQYDWTAKRYPPPSSSPPFPADLAAFVRALSAAAAAGMGMGEGGGNGGGKGGGMRPEAAIANFYSPGDVLGVHRDVSEGCGAPLVSVSVGCEGVFVVAASDGGDGGGGAAEGMEGSAGESEGGKRVLAVRLRSGDVVIMSGPARFAWHGVPLVVAGTCPDGLAEWPARAEVDRGGGQASTYESWRGWMREKRVNLNVRQMHKAEVS